MCSRYDFEKSYLPQRSIFLIVYVPNINFKKPIIEEKYRINFKKLCGILFLQKDLGCPELGENRAPLKTHSYLLFRNCFLTQMKS